MDCIGYRGDTGIVGGFACFCQPTESDCIFPEVSAGTGHSFYQERGEVKTEKMRVSTVMTIILQLF